MANKDVAPEDMKKWDALLKKEGLAAELPQETEPLPAETEEGTENGGIEAGETEDAGEENPETVKVFIREVQHYYETESNARYGDHLPIMLELTKRLGLEPGERWTELVKRVEMDLSRAQTAIKDLARELRGEDPDIHPKLLKSKLRRKLLTRFKDQIDENILKHIIDRIEDDYLFK